MLVSDSTEANQKDDAMNQEDKRGCNDDTQTGAQAAVEIDKGAQVKFLTCDQYPQPLEQNNIWFGASVSARSVKVISENTADAERDNWW